MENVLLSPPHFLHKIRHCYSQYGSRKDVKVESCERRLEAPKSLRGGTGNNQALEMQALPHAAPSPSLSALRDRLRVCCRPPVCPVPMALSLPFLWLLPFSVREIAPVALLPVFSGKLVLFGLRQSSKLLRQVLGAAKVRTLFCRKCLCFKVSRASHGQRPEPGLLLLLVQR